jgi:iron complex transport system substrate-binding protein
MHIKNFSTHFRYIAVLAIIGIFLVACSTQQATTLAPSPTSSPQPSNTPVTEEVIESTSTPLPPPTEEPLSFEDGLGRMVELNEPAQRVVSMAPSNTEILFAVGAGGQVVGVDEFSDYPNQANDLPRIGGGFGDYNLEEIVNLKPDLVLAAEINTPEQVNALEDLNLTVYFLPNPNSLDDMYENLLTIADLTGHRGETDELVEALRDRVNQVLSQIESAQAIPTVFYELDATDPSAPWTAGSGTFIDTLITMAGGENVASDMEGQYLQLSIEELLLRDPQVILLGDAAYGITPESLSERTGWSNIAAIQDNKIYTFDDNLVSRPGPRLVDGLEELAKLLHPELFAE